MSSRREFITLIGGAATWPLAARAQQPSSLLRVGTVSFIRRTNFTWAAFERRMRELGYIEGQNFAVEFINAKDHVERIGEAARDLSRRKVDIGLADSHLTLKSIAAAMSTSPIVFIASNFDPVALGFVASIARRAATSPAFTSAGRNWSKSRSECSLSLFRERLGWLCFGMSLWPKASRPPSGQLLRCI